LPGVADLSDARPRTLVKRNSEIDASRAPAAEQDAQCMVYASRRRCQPPPLRSNAMGTAAR
jgi:hypothetical protein